ncbi:MAG: hypothetical protein PW790_07380 [Parvibaculaceae bacterium]|nr:hypothetical protein [Parvibaculaceae bacterium]
MTPHVTNVMQTFFGTLMAQIAPALGSEYLIGSTSVIAMMMSMAGTEYERGAEVRVMENREMRTLFAAAAPGIGDSALSRRLEEASGGEDTSLRISDLDRTNAALKQLLIELHSHVEELEGPDATDLDRRIWAFMRNAAERRKLPHPLAAA